MKRDYVARPVVIRRRTGVRWEARRWGHDSDFTDGSLRELSTNERRNRMIVGEYVGNALSYGKTLIFACNIDHADALTEQLMNAGVDARPVHSRRSAEQNEEAIRQFAATPPGVGVLVNVAKMTHGVDIPDVKTIFLCRPHSE